LRTGGFKKSFLLLTPDRRSDCNCYKMFTFPSLYHGCQNRWHR